MYNDGKVAKASSLVPQREISVFKAALPSTRRGSWDLSNSHKRH